MIGGHPDHGYSGVSTGSQSGQESAYGGAAFDMGNPMGAYGDRGLINLFDKVALKMNTTPAYQSTMDRVMSLYDAFDPKGRYDHNPHLDTFEPGAYSFDPLRTFDPQRYNVPVRNWMDRPKFQKTALVLGLDDYAFLNPAYLDKHMEVEEYDVEHIDIPLPGPDLRSVPTGPGSSGFSPGI